MKKIKSYVSRDNDLHRLLFLPNGLPDGTELAYYVKTQVCYCRQMTCSAYFHGNFN